MSAGESGNSQRNVAMPSSITATLRRNHGLRAFSGRVSRFRQILSTSLRPARQETKVAFAHHRFKRLRAKRTSHVGKLRPSAIDATALSELTTRARTSAVPSERPSGRGTFNKCKASAFSTLVLLAVCAPRLGVASPHVEAPAGCGTSSEFAGELKKRLGRESAIPPTGLRIERVGDGYRLDMQLGGEKRELFDRSCRELFRAAVVIVVARASERSERPAPKPANSSESSHAANTGARSPTDWHLRLGLGGGVNLGLSPRPGVALELEAQALRQHLGIALAIRHLVKTGQQDEQDFGVSVRGLGGRLALAYLLGPTWQAQAGIGAYWLQGSGLGRIDRANGAAWAVGPTAGLAAVPLHGSGIWVSAGAETQLNLLRARYEILNYGEVFRVSLFSVSIFLRLGWEFF